MNKFNELYESIMNEGTAPALTVAKEIARALKGDYYKDEMADHEVYGIYIPKLNVSLSVGFMGNNVNLEDGRLTGQDKTLVKGIARRMGYETDL